MVSKRDTGPEGHGSQQPGDFENAPLLEGSSSSSLVLPGPNSSSQPIPALSSPGQNGHGPLLEANTEDDDEIDPNEFDILLSRSVPTSGGFLEPESTEHPMLRGPRRYSSASGRRPSGAALYRPLSIPRSTIEDDEFPSPGAPGPDQGDDGTTSHRGSTDHHHDPERAPLLGPSQSPSSIPSTPSTPFLNGISIPRFRLIFAEILLTYFIACFDGTIMASSHPVITSYFHSSNSASWLSTAFLLTSTAFQPLLGRISDSVGRKPPYLITMVIFAASTLWCACAGSMTSFILARAACGLGAGGMMTLGSIIVSDLVPIEMRGSYQGYINIIYGAGSALGAALGGAMADYLGWRWEFGVQVIPLLVCVVIASVAVPNDLGLVGKRETFAQALRAFDFRGSLLLMTAITFFVLGLNLGGNVLPWSHPFVIASLVIFAVCFPSFLYSQSLAKRPIMPLYLLRESPRSNLIFGNFFASLLMNAILFNIPLFFQAVLLTTATTSGLNLVLPSIVSSLAGTATGFLITRTRRLKWPVVSGSILFLTGTLCLSLLRRGWPQFLYLLVLVPHSLGQGFQFPGSLMAVLAASEQKEQAVVTGTLIVWRSLGNVLGVASSSLVMQNALVYYLERFVKGPEKRAVIAKVRESVESVAGLKGDYRGQVVASYEAALRVTFMCCAVLAAVSVCLVVGIKLPRLGQRK